MSERSDRINLTEIREHAERFVGHPFLYENSALMPIPVVFALLDAVEAAEEMAAEAGGRFELPAWQKLEAALARFDFGGRA